MSEHKDAAGARDDEDISVADEQALRAMFAALVQDAEPSAQSPLDIQRRAKAEQRSTADRRATRVRYVRGGLIAAVLVGLIALVVPQLGGTSTETAASSSASSAPAASSVSAAAASAAAGSYAGNGAAADGGSSDASSAAASGAASSGGAAVGDAPAGAATSGAASSGAMSSAAAAAPSAGGASSAAASSSAAAGRPAPASSGSASSGSAASSASQGPCVRLPTRALADVRAAMPGYRGAIRISSCTVQTSAGPATGTTTFVVDRSGRASCGESVAACPVPAGAGARIGATGDAYDYPGGIVVTGRGGVNVTATATAGGPNRLTLLAGVRALLETLD